MKVTELRHLDGVKGNFGITDGTEYRASANAQESQVPPQIIISTFKELVEQQKFFFDMLWNKAISSEQKIKEIEEGIIPDFIETIRNPVEIQKLQLKLMNSAEKEILIIFPTVNMFHRQEQAGLIQSLQDVLKRKLSLMIRILTPIDATMQNFVPKRINISITSFFYRIEGNYHP